MSRKYLQIKPTTLSYSISSSQTSFRFQGFTKLDGTSITASDIGDYVTGTLGPGTSREEIISFGSSDVTVNADGTVDVVSVVRGLEEIDNYSTGGFASEHGAGEVFVLSNNPQLYAAFANKYNNETISGIWSAPVGGTGSQIATNQDIANAVSGASGTATEATAGTSKLSVSATSVPNPIVVGDNDPRIAPNNHATSTGSANAYVVTLTKDPASLVKGQTYSFLSNFANTSACTVNINALGAKTIKKLGGATDLVSGDIASGMVVELIYDGTNMIMLNPVANAVVPGYDGPRLTRLAGYSVANNTTENTVFTTTITGNLLSSTGAIRFRTPFQFNGSSSVAETWTVRMKYGGSTIQTISVTMPQGGANVGVMAGTLEGWIVNSGATNTQNVGFYVVGGTTGHISNNIYTCPAAYSATDTTSAIDTTSNQTLTMTIQKSAANGQTGIFYQTLVETVKNAQ